MLGSLKRLADTYRPRLRPSFLIIGAQKAGTSALFKLLAAHQRILAPTIKEHHFFDRPEEHARGLKHYWKGFPMRQLRGNRTITFEATPNYLFQEAVPKRIHEALPDTKLIVILRDPVRRAYSAWNMYRQFIDSPQYAHLHDPRTFEQAVEDELNGRTRMDPHLYLARGRYAPQLRRYFDLFGRERLLILKHPQLDKEPATVMEQCCSFLGLEAYIGDPTRLTVRDNVRSYAEPLSAEIQQRLMAHFTPHMAELKDLLGKDWDLMAGER